MTGPDPAEKKPTRATRGGASAEPPPPDPITTDATHRGRRGGDPCRSRRDAGRAPDDQGRGCGSGRTDPRARADPGGGPRPGPRTRRSPQRRRPGTGRRSGRARSRAERRCRCSRCSRCSRGGAGRTGRGPTPARLSTPDVAGAVDKAIDGLRTYLTVGEIVAGLGAVGILMIAWATFGVIFGHGGTWPSEVVMLLSIGLLAVLVLQNAHWHDFGPNYRLIVAGACFALGILAVPEPPRAAARCGRRATFDIGGLTWWAGAWVAVLGGVHGLARGPLSRAARWVGSFGP